MASSKPASAFRGDLAAWRVEGVAAEAGFGAAVILAAAGLGWLVRLAFPNMLPGGLLFPALLLAGLVGGWRGGATAVVLAFVARFTFLRPLTDPILIGDAAGYANLAIFVVSTSAVALIGAWVRDLLGRLRRAHDLLAEQTLRYGALFENVPEGFAVCDAIRDGAGRLIDYRIVEMNPALRRLLNVGPEAIGSRLSEAPGNWKRWLEVCDRVLTTGQPVGFERFNAASKLWHEVRISCLTPTRMVQFFFDITERKAAEARQAELFDELNHRVKNNLAMVAGLLDLQAKGAPEAARGELAKAAGRVRSIADVHAALAGDAGAGAGSVDFAAYLEDLVGRLDRSLGLREGVRLALRTEPANLPAEAAVPLGMAVNELVTNAVKYAYPSPAAGPIEVALERRGEDLLLSVSDEGVGLPTNGGRNGLGMRLVRSLAGQAGGELTVGAGAGAGVGARFEIRLRDAGRVA
jgi:two-component sensor histidine kinase/PAS domain-containing protein